MVLKSFDELKKQLKTTSAAPKKVVVANPVDKQTLTAVMTLKEEGLLNPVLVGDKKVISELMSELKHDDLSVDIIDIIGDVEIAEKAVSIIKSGLGDVLMKGHIQTRDLLKAVVNKESGIRDSDTLSHVAINEIPYYHKLLFLTDGGMLLTPDVDAKEKLLNNALSLTKKLGYKQTNVGVLDASENVNPKLQASLDANELKERFTKQADTSIFVEGPISLDLSLSKDIAKEKEYDSPVSGEVDILLVPDIVSGNLLGKSMMTFGQGKMAGLVLGATVPIIITSRGSTVEEKMNSLMIACAM
ncbi:phosphate acyltransferase [Vagococcus luciliae]|uniref:Phosphate acetyltransferase n=1 Tax=Vagococcus luciliae TaxID=2920380 RepID=A0ABY5P1A5_9ENTE|nr:phosphate acyltransferase [Vagococcus luciliae]UUV99709.1 Phosphate acetyltransferase [Vagococcus luciliae]